MTYLHEQAWRSHERMRQQLLRQRYGALVGDHDYGQKRLDAR